MSNRFSLWQVIGYFVGIEEMAKHYGAQCEIHWDTLEVREEEAYVDMTMVPKHSVNFIKVEIQI